MEDYLSEKEQWEWVKAQVRENGPAVILAVVVVLAGLAGWRWWQEHQDAARLEAGSRYMQMVQALEQGDRTQALVLLGQLERENPGSPYTDQAKLLAARVYVDDGDLDKAARELAAVAEHSKDRELALVARLRLARVQIAQGQADAALETLRAPMPAHSRRASTRCAAMPTSPRATRLRRSTSTAAPRARQRTPVRMLDLKIADLAAAGPAK